VLLGQGSQGCVPSSNAGAVTLYSVVWMKSIPVAPKAAKITFASSRLRPTGGGCR
jgi:hypothetical protein